MKKGETHSPITKRQRSRNLTPVCAGSNPARAASEKSKESPTQRQVRNIWEENIYSFGTP